MKIGTVVELFCGCVGETTNDVVATVAPHVRVRFTKTCSVCSAYVAVGGVYLNTRSAPKVGEEKDVFLMILKPRDPLAVELDERFSEA